ncbi:hypothetical protein SELMODRAFT_419954 [Selaginella moellendorffii]|uniref:CHCH domain-containing protein n=1 Tax=Selaginella moellendorffii TaxID=88036 RepID=D8SA38_SELML|nr:hypothetical protein SELMODRAFT_419954 [Selaginella moellendorffii]
MPRRGGGKAPPRPKAVQRPNSAPPPSVYHAPAPSMLGGLAATIAQGAAFGTGSAVAHRAVDAIAGPRTVHHEHTTVASAQPAMSPQRSMDDLCLNATKAFQECVNSNLNDIGKCQFLLDMLNECRKTSSGPSQP